MVKLLQAIWKGNQELHWFWWCCSKLFRTWWQHSHSRTKLSTGYRFIQKVGLAPSVTPSHILSCITRLGNEVRWISSGMLHRLHFSNFILLTSTITISLNQKGQIKSIKSVFWNKEQKITNNNNNLEARSLVPNLAISDVLS